MNIDIKLLLIPAATLFLGACLVLKQPPQDIRYYTLSHSPVEQFATTLPVSLKIAKFSVAPLYNTSRIIYAKNATSQQAYSYHKWCVNPGNMVSEHLYRYFSQSNAFKAVFPYSSSNNAAYRLDGHVAEFYEQDREDLWTARLVLTVALICEKELDPSKRVLLQKTYSSAVPCAKKNPGALAEAMGRAATEISANIIKDISKELTKINR